MLSKSLEEAVRAVVRDELASIGGKLLATHGDGSADPNPTLATVGGYLLAATGDGPDPEETA